MEYVGRGIKGSNSGSGCLPHAYFTCALSTRPYAKSWECEGLKQPRFPSRFQRSVGGGPVEERWRTTWRTLENVGNDAHVDADPARESTRVQKVRGISSRGRGAPFASYARSFARGEDFARALVSSRTGEDSRGTSFSPSSVSQGQWSREEEEDLSYETSHNSTPIGPAEECNLSRRLCICESN